MHIIHTVVSAVTTDECISIVWNTRFCLTFLTCVAQTENRPTWLETLVATKQFVVNAFNVPFSSLIVFTALLSVCLVCASARTTEYSLLWFLLIWYDVSVPGDRLRTLYSWARDRWFWGIWTLRSCSYGCEVWIFFKLNSCPEVCELCWWGT